MADKKPPREDKPAGLFVKGDGAQAARAPLRQRASSSAPDPTILSVILPPVQSPPRQASAPASTEPASVPPPPPFIAPHRFYRPPFTPSVASGAFESASARRGRAFSVPPRPPPPPYPGLAQFNPRAQSVETGSFARLPKEQRNSKPRLAMPAIAEAANEGSLQRESPSTIVSSFSTTDVDSSRF